MAEEATTTTAKKAEEPKEEKTVETPPGPEPIMSSQQIEGLGGCHEATAHGQHTGLCGREQIGQHLPLEAPVILLPIEREHFTQFQACPLGDERVQFEKRDLQSTG